MALGNMAHHQRIKFGRSQQFLEKAPLLFEREPAKGCHHLLRYTFLLALMLCAAASVLRLSAAPSPAASVVHPSDLFVAEARRDMNSSLKTHIPSNENRLQAQEEKGSGAASPPCADLIQGMKGVDEGFLCCDRSHYRTDVCYMRGDIRTNSSSSSIMLYGAGKDANTEKLRPYTRKWETTVMATIDEITLRPVPPSNNSDTGRQCDVRHRAPAIVLSTGGYTGNLYHEFNDGLIPLYITAERFGGEVVLVVAEYHSWWMAKYRKVVEKLSKHKVVDLSKDARVHCFPEMIVGLRIHGELAIKPQLMPDGKGIQDFQSLLAEAFLDDQQHPPPPPPQLPPPHFPSTLRPTIAIFIRNKSRVLQNLKEIVKACERAGFQVRLLNPRRTTPLADIYAALRSADAMLAVHGAAMTHFLFMRPGTVLVQVVPLGVDWAAEEYYGEPAKRLGLEYMAYKVAPQESSLYREYDRQDPVLADPGSITSKGWSETKRVYLDRQNVRLNLKRFSRVIAKAYSHLVNHSRSAQS